MPLQDLQLIAALNSFFVQMVLRTWNEHNQHAIFLHEHASITYMTGNFYG